MRFESRLWVSTALVVAAGVSSNATASVQINIQDIPEQNITLVTAANPIFDGQLRKIFGTGSDMDDPALVVQRPFSVILENGSGQTLIGMSFRYTEIDSAGTTTTHDLFFFALDGVKDARIPPAGLAWVTPRRVMNHAWNQAIPLQVQQSAIADMSKLAGLSRLTISLDAVIYDDGTFAGANATHAFEQATASVWQKRLLAQELVRRQSAGQTDEEITGWLRGLNSPDPDYRVQDIDTLDWSNRYRAQYARRLLLAYQSGGSEGAHKLARYTLDLPTVQIRQRAKDGRSRN